MNRWKMYLVLLVAACFLTACTDQERNELREKVLRYLRIIHPVSIETTKG